jgi:hypothetical protein
MSREAPPPSPGGNRDETPRWFGSAYWGGIAGLVAGVATVVVVGGLHRPPHGQPTQNCVALGCVVGVLLSHAAGLLGMVTGAVIGAVIGLLVHRASGPSRAR